MILELRWIGRPILDAPQDQKEVLIIANNIELVIYFYVDNTVMRIRIRSNPHSFVSVDTGPKVYCMSKKAYKIYIFDTVPLRFPVLAVPRVLGHHKSPRPFAPQLRHCGSQVSCCWFCCCFCCRCCCSLCLIVTAVGHH